jgi:alkanesulfonate monooxygenase SsuD/methylene tetrahydromethanopterin reductase-like flavin-dependent oxidoreductase (luciferase family)
MTIELGLFDIHQVDPSDSAPPHTVFERRLQLLALADRAGLRYAFTAERHFMANYWTPAPTAWIAAASQRTSSIRLGVLAYTLPLHLPVALAEEIAVLDHLTRGRLEIGFGLGHRREELAAIGLDPDERERLFQERFAVMTALWEGGVVTLERPSMTVREVAIFPRPLQEPYPPVWFAGSDPRDEPGRWFPAYGGAGANRHSIPGWTCEGTECSRQRAGGTDAACFDCTDR